MVQRSSPDRGRSTSEAAITELKKEITRNEVAQKAARKKRASREKGHLANLWRWNQV